MLFRVKRPISLLGLVAALAASGAAAQSPAVPSMSQNLPPISIGQVTLNAGATFAGSNEPIRSGLVWRIYEDRGDASQPVIVARSTSPTPSFTLQPGNYIIHVAYGFASASKRISVQRGNLNERLAINAGALQLKGAVGGSPIAPNRLSFSVYVPEAQNSEGRLVIADAKANDMIRLPEGTYHVVSTYGDANAIMRSDLKVESGRVTEATLNHRAATVTLKLVGSAGGEAFAGTAFSVLTPGGDVIREAIGAFPSVTLAEGEYILIARHDGKVYTREFKVESGLDRDIEVLARP
ncbi:DUF4493 domain-containing protein [Microvirga arsenatis]|uniref:Uncharacterized protein n=1 Tax=Microvirga arsenatis TaxID=2692265 RepID=A0ABW9Z553_9HYPH|nr:DUF4493 domain-containing protein [Microvirga arsenatis]NBJ12284.1 hypothetical protein [Microvirga arsenatis]NBJ26076.1 hypothetical protein [Microvirga arsenatis]